MADDKRTSTNANDKKRKGGVDFLFNPLKKKFLKKSNFKKLIQKFRQQQIRIRSAANRFADEWIEKEQGVKLELQPLREKKNRSARKKRKISRMLSGKMHQLIHSLKLSGLKKTDQK